MHPFVANFVCFLTVACILGAGADVSGQGCLPAVTPPAKGNGMTTGQGGAPGGSFGPGSLGLPSIPGLGGVPDLGSPGPGSWNSLPNMPKALGEVAAGVIDGTIYVIGEGSGSTLTYDLDTGIWSSGQADSRTFKGNHHGAEVLDGLLYVIGGFDNGSEARVQIYDPVTDSWSLGADMPWNGGSVCSATINGKIYVAGGVVDDLFTTDQCAVYDPIADTWTPLAPMIDGRNHAASASDGRRMWVFGGRGPGSGDTNMVANGFADVQVYDPDTDSWASSNVPGTPLTPMPIGRGGTGKALYFEGEFYVFGGETVNGPGAEPGGVYDRVDIYCPNSGTWRQGADMPTARHGIFPVRVRRLAYLAGGGTVSGGSESNFAELYVLP